MADYLELLALAGRSLSIEDVADVIRDNRWTSALGERIGAPNPPDEDESSLGVEIDEALERANDIVAVFAQREHATKDLYPFRQVASGRIEYIGNVARDDPYVRLLAITVAHATRLVAKPPPFQVFEVMVVKAFERSGYRTAGIGARARSGGLFRDVLIESCESVGLEAYPERAAARTFAHDEGSDVISNVWTSDLRPGGLQLVGQVTCARSNDWDAKIQEPAPMQWRSWLGDFRLPSVYLAVPHHVEDATRTWLMSKRDRDVFDRLRLCCMLSDEKVPGEAEVVDAILNEDILGGLVSLG